MELTEDRVREWLPIAHAVAAYHCNTHHVPEWLDEARCQSALILCEELAKFNTSRNSDLKGYIRSRLHWRIKDFFRAMQFTGRAANGYRRLEIVSTPLSENRSESMQIEFMSPGIIRALNSLTERQRHVLEAIAIHGTSTIEVARQLDIHPRRVNQLYNLARENMRKRLVN